MTDFSTALRNGAIGRTLFHRHQPCRYNLVSGEDICFLDTLHDPVGQRVTHLACRRDSPDDWQIVQRIFTNIGKCAQRNLMAEERFNTALTALTPGADQAKPAPIAITSL